MGEIVDVCLKISCFHPEECTEESTSKAWFVTNAIVGQNHRMQLISSRWRSIVSASPLFPFLVEREQMGVAIDVCLKIFCFHPEE